MKFIESWFGVFCVLAALAGLFMPTIGDPLSGTIKFMLGCILFFTGLKLDFAAAFHELVRPRMVIYLAMMRLIVLPIVMYQIACLLLPLPLAIGVLIVAAMPAGNACSALTDIARGNTALALVGTVATSMLCPVVTPGIIKFCCGYEANGGLIFLFEQAVFLAIILFAPLGAALLLRKFFPKPIEQQRDLWSILAMVSLFLLICGSLALVRKDFTGMIRTAPMQAAGLFAFMCFFSMLFHIVGYLMAPWRPVSDRVAVSVNIAYVNNGLAIVFAVEFFRQIPEIGAAAVLPAILLEIPMDLAIIPLKAFANRHQKYIQRHRLKRQNDSNSEITGIT